MHTLEWPRNGSCRGTKGQSSCRSPQHIGSTRLRMVASLQWAKRTRTMHSGRPFVRGNASFPKLPSAATWPSLPYPTLLPCPSLSLVLLTPVTLSPHLFPSNALISPYLSVTIRHPFPSLPLPRLPLYLCLYPSAPIPLFLTQLTSSHLPILIPTLVFLSYLRSPSRHPYQLPLCPVVIPITLLYTPVPLRTSPHSVSVRLP